MEIKRRSFLRGIAALGLTVGLPGLAYARPRANGFLTTGRDTLSGQFLMARIDSDFDIVWETKLPGRAHDIVLQQEAGHGLVVARRPGLFACVFDQMTGEVLTTIKPHPGRHFYGHGVYSPDGQTLYLTENAYDTGTGVIGVYDVADGYRRCGEMESSGIGPHELAFLADGQTLGVANGGIKTHPNTGRKKLNLDTLESSFAVIDPVAGRVREKYLLPGNRSRYLSIRHMAATRHGAVLACQDQREGKADTTLVYRYDASTADQLVALEINPGDLQRFQGYCGSVAFDPKTDCVAVSSPRGGIIGLWQGSKSYAWLGRAELVDGCGLDRNPAGQGFVASSGRGVLENISRNGHVTDAGDHPFRQWDNHLTSLL